MKHVVRAVVAAILILAALPAGFAGASASPADPPSAVPHARNTALPVATESTLLYANAATNSRRIGTIKKDEVLPINARSKDNNWLRTSTGAWIQADSVDNNINILQVSETSYNRASAAEFNYLKQVIRQQLSFLNAAANIDPENSDTIVELLAQVDALEQWNQGTKPPSTIADAGEWMDAVTTLCSSAASIMSNSELWAGCARAMATGYIPQKFQALGASILPTPTPAPPPAPTSTPVANGQGSYGQQVLGLFTKAGLKISAAEKATVDTNDPLPDTYVERWEFGVAEVAPKGGQIFVCETKKDCDVLFEYFSMLSALAGPNLFQSPNGRVVAQLNSGMSPDTARRFQNVINSLDK